MSPALTDLDKGVAAPPVSPSASPRSPEPVSTPTSPRGRWRRVIRFGLGLTCLGFAALALLPPPFTIDSEQAVINAPLLILRSPIAGTVRMPGTGSPVIEVDAHVTDDSHLDQLRGELATLRVRVELERQQFGIINDLSARLTNSAEKYQAAVIRRLEHLRDAAQSTVAQTEAVRKQRDYERDLAGKLVTSGSVSGLEFTSNRYTAEAAGQGALHEKQLLARVEEELRAAREGVYVGEGDGRADYPYSGQRLHELALRGADLRLALRQDEVRLTEVESQIRAEEARLARHARFRVTPEGVVWRRHAADGSAVTAGAALVDCLHPSAIFIDALFQEKYLSQLRPGKEAVVRLTGTGETFPVVVKQVTGRSLPWAESMLATESLPLGQRQAHVLFGFAGDPAGSAFPATIVGRSATVSLRRDFWSAPSHPPGTNGP